MMPAKIGVVQMQTKGGRNRPYRLEIEHVNGKRLTGSTWDSLDGALTEAKGLVESESSRVEAVRIFHVVQGRWSFLRAVRKTVR